MIQASSTVYKRDFWIKENLNYVKPHFRMLKAARLVNRIANGRECDLLDVGCGPATLMHLLEPNIRYYGIDIAIHQPAPNLEQIDFLQEPIGCGGKKFDIIVAQGVFEYVGSHQNQKFAEIRGLLGQRGKFLVSYVNFDHLHRYIYWPYSNVQGFDEFQRSLARYFHIDRVFPTSYHWHHHEPTRRFMQAIQLPIEVKIPFLSRWFAVEYFFICSVLP